MIDLKKSKRNITHIVIHCTATPEGRFHNAKDIDSWHKKLGWSKIGYNYVILLDGSIEIGRDIDEVPSHVKGYNKNTIGIVYVGGIDKNSFQPKDTRTLQQKNAMESLLKNLRKLYPKAEILGHRDFPNVKKACPCFDAKKEYKYI